MQLNNYKWAVVSALCALSVGRLHSQPPVGAVNTSSGCVSDPLSVVIKDVDISGDRLNQILLLAARNRVCLAIDGWPDQTQATEVHLRQGTVQTALLKLFPGFDIEVLDNVASIKKRGMGQSWLDYNLPRFQIKRHSLFFNSAQLFFFLRDQALHPQGGYAGSISQPAEDDNLVGPFTEEHRSLRDLLDILLSRSTRGGVWIVTEPPPRRAPLPQAPFWKIFPFEKDPNDVLKWLQATIRSTELH